MSGLPLKAGLRCRRLGQASAGPLAVHGRSKLAELWKGWSPGEYTNGYAALGAEVQRLRENKDCEGSTLIKPLSTLLVL